ncbi:MAG: hypothetical protein K0S30_116 [Clostridia bacterium]|nr:hypothetical protein [Clostridia bacterium]
MRNIIREVKTMDVIIQHNEKSDSYLGQYANQIENLGPVYKVLEIQEKHLSWLNEMTEYIEPIFAIQLREEQLLQKEEVCFETVPMLLAIIGSKQDHKQIDGYYHMNTQTFQETPHPEVRLQTIKVISCYSDHQVISSKEYIQCIRYLTDKAKDLHKSLVIYGNFYVPDENYRYRALAYKIINEYMMRTNGVLIIRAAKAERHKYYNASPKSYEFYLERSIYLHNNFKAAVRKALPFLYDDHSPDRFKNMYRYTRQNDTLYDDVFYLSIPAEQEIYVLLNSGNYNKPEYYESFGIQSIRLIDDYSILYAAKSIFDANSRVLKPQVAPQYYVPILSYGACYKNSVGVEADYDLVTDNLQYRGRGVYIGIVGVDGVDYTNTALRNPDGTTRIACIWEQIEGGEGQYYLAQQINDALGSENPDQIIGLPQGDSTTTMALSIAGGSDNREATYRGIATEAEFLVAKVNRGPEVLQRIYGGLPSENGVVMPDALIGAIKLIEFAKEANRPLVLCMPYNGSIDPHDGSYTLNQILGLMAQRVNLTIIVPAGEEADKMHHEGLEGGQETLKIINMRVEKEEQNVMGIIYQKFLTLLSVLLYPPQGVELEPIELKRMGVTRVGERTIIYSNGEKINFSNGAREIMFRLDNPRVGGWRIEMSLQTNAESKIDLWLAQQELNGYTNLRPSSPFMTVGSTGNIVGIMTVGAYDRETMVILKSSGRGFSWSNQVKPLYVTHANQIVAFCGGGGWVSVGGTLVASSIMAGVVATLYHKFIEEDVSPLPNTLIMNSILLGVVNQFEGVEYPNPSQGYGIFDLQSLAGLLATPFIL